MTRQTSSRWAVRILEEYFFFQIVEDRFKEIFALPEVEGLSSDMLAQKPGAGPQEEKKFMVKLLPRFSDTSVGIFSFERNSTACFKLHNP